MRSFRGKALTAVMACVCGMLLVAAPAGAVTVLLGPEDLSASDPFAECDSVCSAKVFVPTEVPGATLVTPADGTVVSWRVKGTLPTHIRLRVLRAAAGGQFLAVDTSGKAAASDGSGSTPAAIGIKAGDQLGIEIETNFPSFTPTTLLGDATVPGAAWSGFEAGISDGQTASPTVTGSGSLPLFNATVELEKPQIFQMSSTQGPTAGGEAVVLTGQHLAIAQSVKFGSVSGQIIKADNNQVIAVAPPHDPGTVEVTVETAGGSSTDSTADLYTYAQPAAPPDLAPRLWGLSFSPKAFEAAGGGPSAKAAAATGTRVSFQSSEAARVKFSVQRRTKRRWVRVPGSFTRQAGAGPNSFIFSGRVGGKRLSAGSYKLLAKATDPSGKRSKQVRRSFRVVGSGRG